MPAGENADLGATAALCDAAWIVFSDARQGAGAADSAQATAIATRTAATDALRARVRGLINELEQLLAPDDPRWEEFGLTIPAHPSAPEPVASVTLEALSNHRIGVDDEGGNIVGSGPMSTITTKDGTTIYYKDWGPKDGPVVTFSHGWPLSSDAWEAQMFFLASHGYRCIGHDRRGHGRSSQPWDGNHMDQYADDLAELFEKLDVQGAMMVGHSTGGGEVARYIGRHGTKRVAKAVLMGAVPPIMLKTAANPGGLPIEVFDGFRAAYLADRAQFFLDVASGPFFGFNRPGAKVSQGLIQAWWLQGMMCGHKNGYDCIKAFSETDFTEDLKKFDVPTLIIHGDDDQIVPIDASAKLAAKLVPGAQLKIYPGGSHSLGDTSKDQLNADLLEFAKS